MKIVITGATGFLGGETAVYFAQKGYQVTAVGRRTCPERLLGMRIEFRQADLAEDSLAEIFAGTDYVVHCAALSSPWGRYEDFYRCNVLATRKVCQACLETGVKKLIHISTPGLYFNFQDRHHIREADPLPERKANFYAQTKFLAEEEVQAAVKQGLNAVLLRPRAIFGPGDRALLPRLIEVNKKCFIPQMRPHDGPLCDLTYVDNVVQAIDMALQASVPSGRVYNITNGEPVHLLRAVKELLQQMNFPFKSKKIPYSIAAFYAAALEKFYSWFLPGKEPAFTAYTVALLAKDQTLDISRAQKELGYHPEVSLQEGLKRTAQAWKK